MTTIPLPKSSHVDAPTLAHAPASEALMAIQENQFRHDELYHREIARLPLRERMNHLALHLAKYVGQIAGIVDRNDDSLEPELDRVLTDSFIIAVSAANCLNMRLSDHVLVEGRGSEPLKSAYEKLGIQNIDRYNEGGGRLLFDLAQAVGRFAKACESVDHIEDYPFRAKMIESLANILSVLIAHSAATKRDIFALRENRLSRVKKKSVFHDYFTNDCAQP